MFHFLGAKTGRPSGFSGVGRWIALRVGTVDSAFNELGFNEISEFLNIHFFITDFFNKDITMKEDKILLFLGPLNFAK